MPTATENTIETTEATTNTTSQAVSSDDWDFTGVTVCKMEEGCEVCQ